MHRLEKKKSKINHLSFHFRKLGEKIKRLNPNRQEKKRQEKGLEQPTNTEGEPS